MVQSSYMQHFLGSMNLFHDLENPFHDFTLYLLFVVSVSVAYASGKLIQVLTAFISCILWLLLCALHFIKKPMFTVHSCYHDSFILPYIYYRSFKVVGSFLCG